MKKFKLYEYIEKLSKDDLVVTSDVEKIRDIVINKVCYNSNDVEKDTLFVCKGVKFKEEYLKDAIVKGAIAYISETKYSEDIPCILVSDIQKSLAIVAKMYFNNPTDKLNMIGITGTKGKSTTAYYVKSILDSYMKEVDGTDTAILSSINNYDGKTNVESVLTTQESYEIEKYARNAVDSNLKNLVMEVSSQALKKDRVYGITYDEAVFLNISEDHISNIEHPDFNDYFESKLKIFKQAKVACVNLNMDNIENLLKVLDYAKNSEKIITFGTTRNADIFAYNIEKKGLHTSFKVRTPYFNNKILLTMPGLFNIENALAAIAVAVAMKIPYKNIYEGLKVARSSGRMELYTNKDKKIIAIVDYAHNKLSFEKLYESTIKEYPDKKIVTVFGCPGGHAMIRRRDLGVLSGLNSDITYLTAEDPGIESAIDICEEIAGYVKKVGGKYKIIEDRGEAIRTAIMENPDSVILITGKGNETRQKIGTTYVKCLTDVQYAKKALKEYDRINNIQSRTTKKKISK